MGISLVDSNLLLDILTRDPDWYQWSSNAIADAELRGGVAINQIIYGEISFRFESVEELEGMLSMTDFHRMDLPWEAAFMAGKCFRRYKKLGGVKRSPLPDFYIGAHAAVAGLPLLTRDPSRYRSYFPGLEIIAPG